MEFVGDTWSMVLMTRNDQNFVPRGRAQRKPAPRVAWALRETLSRLKTGQGPSVAELASGWSQIAGERLAPLTKPTRLVNAGAKGVLYIDADGAAAVLVEADAKRILQRASLYCGRDVACRVKVSRAPSGSLAPAVANRVPTAGVSLRQARALEQTLEPIDDPGLKEALRALGRTLIGDGVGQASGGGDGHSGVPAGVPARSVVKTAPRDAPLGASGVTRLRDAKTRRDEA